MKKTLLCLCVLFVLVACNNKTNSTQQQESISSSTTSSSNMTSKISENMILNADGKNPSWSLTMDNQKKVSFNLESEKKRISAKVTEVMRSMDGDMLTFQTDYADGIFYFNLMQGKMINTYRLQVVSDIVKEKTEVLYNGSGKLTGIYQVNKKWTLKTVDGKVVTMGDEQPNLTIDLFTGKLYGYTGCNQIMGSVSLDDNQSVVFGQAMMTRKACMDNKYENIIMMAIKDEKAKVKLLGSNQMQIVGNGNILVFGI